MGLTATRFEGLSSGLARLVLLAYAAVAIVVLWFSFPIVEFQNPPDKQGDLATYQTVIDALKSGVPYYEALHEELVTQGYGTRSVFNWRPPFFLMALALAPSPLVAQGVLVALAAAAVMLSLNLAPRGIGWMAGLAILMVVSLVSVIVPGAQNMCELYAGALILLSVAAYARGWHWVGFAAALLALLCRELSAVYVVICVAMALRDRRWREVAAWAVALIGFAIYFAWHAQMAMSMVGPADKAYAEGWLQFGGIGFVLTTANFSGLFLLMPFWVTGAVLPLALLGMLAAPYRASEVVLLAVLGYCALFAFVGKPFNIYWGALYTPLLPLGLIWAIPALRDLLRAATRNDKVAA